MSVDEVVSSLVAFTVATVAGPALVVQIVEFIFNRRHEVEKKTTGASASSIAFERDAICSTKSVGRTKRPISVEPKAWWKPGKRKFLDDPTVSGLRWSRSTSQPLSSLLQPVAPRSASERLFGDFAVSDAGSQWSRASDFSFASVFSFFAVDAEPSNTWKNNPDVANFYSRNMSHLRVRSDIRPRCRSDIFPRRERW